MHKGHTCRNGSTAETHDDPGVSQLQRSPTFQHPKSKHTGHHPHCRDLTKGTRPGAPLQTQRRGSLFGQEHSFWEFPSIVLLLLESRLPQGGSHSHPIISSGERKEIPAFWDFRLSVFFAFLLTLSQFLGSASPIATRYGFTCMDASVLPEITKKKQKLAGKCDRSLRYLEQQEHPRSSCLLTIRRLHPYQYTLHAAPMKREIRVRF